MLDREAMARQIAYEKMSPLGTAGNQNLGACTMHTATQTLHIQSCIRTAGGEAPSFVGGASSARFALKRARPMARARFIIHLVQARRSIPFIIISVANHIIQSRRMQVDLPYCNSSGFQKQGIQEVAICVCSE